MSSLPGVSPFLDLQVFGVFYENARDWGGGRGTTKSVYRQGLGYSSGACSTVPETYRKESSENRFTISTLLKFDRNLIVKKSLKTVQLSLPIHSGRGLD